MKMTDEQPGLLEELKRRKVARVAIGYVVAAWIALQFLDLVFENINAPDWVMQSVMALFAIGLPVALVLAWAFDITEDGIKSTPGSKRAFTVLVVIVSIGAVAFVARSFLGSEPGQEAVPTPVDTPEFRVISSIAVLPFESFSEDRSDEYFADGLADTLLHKLAQLPNLKVIARNSSFQFKGTNKDAREIGELLDVAALLEGSVQRQGDQVRVIVQLIDTADGAHIWSATFDDTIQNIFELQDRLAGEIMVHLQISISKQDRKRVLRNGTDSPEAYDLLLRANDLHLNPSRDVFDPDTDPLLELVDRALAIDPDYAQAWVTRSAAFSSALFFDSDTSRSLEYIDESRRAAERAIEADPEYAEGHVRLAWSYFRARNQVEAERHLLRALELDPNNAGAMSSLGLIKVSSDPKMALDLFTRARELDPQSSFVYRQLSFALRALGRLDEALATLENGIERFPDETILLNDVSSTYQFTYGRPDDAARWASRIVALDSQSFLGPSRMASIWLAVGDTGRSRDWLATYADRFAGTLGVNLAQYAIEMQLGDYDAARQAIEAMPQSPNFRFDRSTRIGGACLVLGDKACMREHADRMQEWLDEFAARGQAYAPGVRYEMAIAVLRNAAVDDVAERDVARIESLLELTASWPPMAGRGSRNVDYFRVMLQSLIGNDEAAVEELQKTLVLDNEGFVAFDIFGMPPRVNPLIVRLKGQDGYAQWQAAFEGRREATRGNLLRMEQSGEILSADDVAL
jgi:TolB-like protein/Tfp pilus assembly protein PilF